MNRKPIIKQIYQITFNEPKKSNEEDQQNKEPKPTMSRKEINARFEEEQYTNTELNDEELPF